MVCLDMATAKKDEPAFTRKTVTLPPDMEAAIDVLVGRGQFSAFVQQALAHELQRENIARRLDEQEAARGGAPLDRDSVRFAERAWRARK